MSIYVKLDTTRKCELAIEVDVVRMQVVRRGVRPADQSVLDGSLALIHPRWHQPCQRLADTLSADTLRRHFLVDVLEYPAVALVWSEFRIAPHGVDHPIQRSVDAAPLLQTWSRPCLAFIVLLRGVA